MCFILCLGQSEMLGAGAQAKVKLALIPNMMYLLTKQAYSQGLTANKLKRRAKAECKFQEPGRSN